MARVAIPWDQLTPQQRLNRQRNEAAKAKRMNVFNITGDQVAKEVPAKKEAPANNIKADEKPQSSNPWVSICDNLISPSVVFPSLCVLSISSYLVWQYSLVPSGDLLTGTIIELLGAIYATVFTVSNSKFVRFISSCAIVCTILYTSIILHGGLKSDASKSDESYKSISIERDSLQKVIDSKTKIAEQLPETYASKKQAILNDINKDTARVGELNSKLEGITQTSTGGVFASLIIRILAMVANAYMVHLVVRGLRK